MLKKFPFGNTLLKELHILQPNRVNWYMVETVANLVKCFPQLRLNDN